MPPKRDPRRRAELLDGVVRHLLAHGLGDLSLRPAAAAIGTSPQILLYYFGSKENLLLEAIGAVRGAERATLARDMERLRFGGSVADVVWTVWRWFSGRRREPYLRLFYEVYALAVSQRRRFQPFLDLVNEDYAEIMEQGLRSWGYGPDEAAAAGTMYLATFRGLLLHLLATGDRRRVDAAVRLLGKRLETELVALRPSQQTGLPIPPALRTKPRRRPRR